MSYTLLQLVDQMSAELGLTQPAAVIGSSNNQTIQILALANRLTVMIGKVAGIRKYF